MLPAVAEREYGPECPLCWRWPIAALIWKGLSLLHAWRGGARKERGHPNLPGSRIHRHSLFSYRLNVINYYLKETKKGAGPGAGGPYHPQKATVRPIQGPGPTMIICMYLRGSVQARSDTREVAVRCGCPTQSSSYSYIHSGAGDPGPVGPYRRYRRQLCTMGAYGHSISRSESYHE